MQETQVGSLGLKDPLEQEMETHSSILVWKIPWRSGFLVVLGIFLNVYSKNMDKMRLPSAYDLINRVMDLRKSRTLAQTV